MKHLDINHSAQKLPFHDSNSVNLQQTTYAPEHLIQYPSGDDFSPVEDEQKSS